MDSVEVQRDGTVGWKNYSGVQKVGRIILVYRRRRLGYRRLEEWLIFVAKGLEVWSLEHSRAKPSLVACLPGTE